MSLIELFFIALGLSMDAFAVSVCKGLSADRAPLSRCLLTGLYCGFFQALMPLMGFLLGAGFSSQIASVDHWIAFVLLTVIGLKMLWDAHSGDDELDGSFRFFSLLPLALATSIDALAVGVGFAFLKIRILPAAALIGTTAFLLSSAGVKLGSLFGNRFRSAAEYLGGGILILTGAKILLEHLYL